MSEKRFPILSDRGNPAPTSCAWSVAEKAYSQYRERYGSRQSLERLAERGGFGANEMDMFYPDWRKEESEIERLNAALRDCEKQLASLKECWMCAGSSTLDGDAEVICAGCFVKEQRRAEAAESRLAERTAELEGARLYAQGVQCSRGHYHLSVLSSCPECVMERRFSRALAAAKAALWDVRNVIALPIPLMTTERLGLAYDTVSAALIGIDKEMMAGDKPVPLVMFCPAGHPHVDEGEWATKPHKTHQCQSDKDECWNGHPNCDLHRYEKCGLEWRPAEFPTVGVKPSEYPGSRPTRKGGTRK